MPTFTPPADNIVGPTAVDDSECDPLANRLMRFYRARPRGRNVFILTDNTVTENLPAATYASNGELIASAWDQVAATFWGGHAPYTVTAAQAALLTGAGYVVS